MWVTYLVPSLAGSAKRQSRVGLPGNWARSTDPSGKTSFFNSSKLWWPGLSLQAMQANLCKLEVESELNKYNVANCP